MIPFCDLAKMATMGFSVESMIRGYHEYQSIWENPSIGESLICEREIGNCYDTHAVAYGPLLPFLLSTETSITSATRSFAEAITPGEIDELNDPVGSGKTLAEGRDLLSTCLKYFRFDMTNHSVVSSLGLGKNRHDKSLSGQQPRTRYTRVRSRDDLKIWWSKSLAN